VKDWYAILQTDKSSSEPVEKVQNKQLMPYDSAMDPTRSCLAASLVDQRSASNLQNPSVWVLTSLGALFFVVLGIVLIHSKWAANLREKEAAFAKREAAFATRENQVSHWAAELSEFEDEVRK
jgi:hypothetical protein